MSELATSYHTHLALNYWTTFSAKDLVPHLFPPTAAYLLITGSKAPWMAATLCFCQLKNLRYIIIFLIFYSSVGRSASKLVQRSLWCHMAEQGSIPHEFHGRRPNRGLPTTNTASEPWKYYLDQSLIPWSREWLGSLLKRVWIFGWSQKSTSPTLVGIENKRELKLPYLVEGYSWEDDTSKSLDDAILRWKFDCTGNPLSHGFSGRL